MIDERPGLDDLNAWLKDEDDEVEDAEYDAFSEWLDQRDLEPEDYEPDAFIELFHDWRSSSEYEQWKADDDADQWSGWEGESNYSDYETRLEDMYYVRDNPGEPEDPDDPYGGADLGYDGVDQMRDEFDREFGPQCCVRARLKPKRGVIKLSLTVVPENDGLE